MDVSLPVNIIYVDCVVFYVYITIQCIYVYTVYICTQKRRGADPAILRTKGRGYWSGRQREGWR